jgi:HSP20 family protein
MKTKKEEHKMAISRWKPETEVTGWTPFRDLFNMQREIGRVFDSLFPEYNSESSIAAQWAPRVDVLEQKESFQIKAELPGVNKSDVKITVHDSVLTIRGEKKQEKEEKDANSHRVERSFGIFERSFSLPTTIKSDKIDASFRDGVLTITLPKVEEAKPKEIEVRLS